jgi:arabinoxylan arabinofuranohydrolase
LANRNAWAPCIVEKKMNGEYKFLYYFTAAQKIGAAVSDNLEGPFTDSGKALIDWNPEGIKGGQEIDPDVFTDPKREKSYLYWGNDYMAGVELNEDMLFIKKQTLTIMTPDDTFREGTYVIYRNETYYFMWSEDDTRSPNYKVRYATRKTPLGKLSFTENNIVIQKDLEKEILGTGHNSAIQVPGTDEWYLVYHRFTFPQWKTWGVLQVFTAKFVLINLSLSRELNIQPELTKKA